MANILVKGLPELLYRKLKERASDEFRSLNQQVIWILNKEMTEVEEEYSTEELEKLEQLAKRTKRGRVVGNMDELRQYLHSLKE